jgi:hypothetical protein
VEQAVKHALQEVHNTHRHTSNAKQQRVPRAFLHCAEIRAGLLFNEDLEDHTPDLDALRSSTTPHLHFLGEGCCCYKWILSPQGGTLRN